MSHFHLVPENNQLSLDQKEKEVWNRQKLFNYG